MFFDCFNLILTTVSLCIIRLNETILKCFSITQTHTFQNIFSNDISIAFSWMKIIEFRLKLHWNMFPAVQLTISQHYLRQWLGADQAINHYLDQWWPSSLTHICGTRGDDLKINVHRNGICLSRYCLTLKRLGHFFQYLILFPNVVQQRCNIFIWNWSNKFNV